MNCPNCASTSVATTIRTEWIPYGDESHAFQATFPVMACHDCSFGWRDYRAEEAIAAAMEEYLTPITEPVIAETVADFSEKVRELLAEYIADNAGVREAYREALLLLAAEL